MDATAPPALKVMMQGKEILKIVELWVARIRRWIMALLLSGKGRATLRMWLKSKLLTQ